MEHPASPIHERLVAALGERTYRSLAEQTGQHPETIRRYMQGSAPSSEFMADICERFQLNGEWLLTGRGPMRTAQIREHALREATSGELLAALGHSLDRLAARVSHLESALRALDHRAGDGGTSAGAARDTTANGDVVRDHPVPANGRPDARAAQRNASG
ncbi:MAG: hypothetical protein JNM07_00510 [Phycisphaerae bacterium]|nr:hypothetical protein [Phycisphaerae bacterium]